ncbi:MAG: hypothetical protein R2862_03465 [Thermoanaerobaculia bacterium]
MSAVSCDDQLMRLVEISLDGRVKPEKTSKLTARVNVTIPPGKDQRVDVALKLMQGEELLGQTHSAQTIDESETSLVSLDLGFKGERLDLNGPKPRLLFQLVSQDAEKKVEQGSSFWWFTIPLPIR